LRAEVGLHFLIEIAVDAVEVEEGGETAQEFSHGRRSPDAA